MERRLVVSHWSLDPLRSRRERRSAAQAASRGGRTRLRVAGIAGLLGVLGNVAAVALLWNAPAAYKLDQLAQWVEQTFAQPIAAAASSVTFTIGLIAMAAWASGLGRWAGGSWARSGGALIAVVSLFNAAGTLAPLVVAYHVGNCGAACDAVARGLLGTSLTLDAFFNLGLGLGLLLVGLGGTQLSRAMRALSVVSGLLTLPVAGQAVWAPAAQWLLVAAPFWLSVMIVTSVLWVRRDPADR
ncbi:MAG: hypothetical protein H6707_20265 [Deltaproteobacteria bacterium]|nr:hypothetical protein [Deltaproteobacteria bacterium]